ncbi:MAG: hypothetical protein LAP38_06980 [Acidobacteriia bacterium]|nr:hypothetical protein [Terriglobia bacterium]
MRYSILLALVLPVFALAQTVAGGGAGAGSVRSGVFNATATFGPVARQAVVAGLPYSCEQVSEHTQTLSDGTNISDRRMVVKMYRDSAGRTRTERPLMIGPAGVAAEAPVMVEIFDPVAGYRYILDATKREAHRSAFAAVPAGAGTPSPGAARVIASQTAQAGTVAMIVPAPAGIAGSPQFPRPEISSESLGTKIIEGSLAEGRRTTMTYAEGSIGNDRPVVVTQEMWNSPELRILLLSTSHDPRSGDSSMKTENLSRAEPDPTLFQVPPDYEIVDDNGPVTLQFSSPPAPAK